MAEGKRPDEGVGWEASWIWSRGEERPRNSFLYLRRSFEVPAAVRSARARVSADSRYRLYVNGRYVGRGPPRSVPPWQYYDVYDLSGELRRGVNVVAALVHHYGESTGQYILGRGGFIFQMEVELAGGGRLLVKTDRTWRVARARAWRQDTPRINGALGFVEVYDAREEPLGWKDVDFDDSAWEEPVVIADGERTTPPVRPWLKMVPRDIPPLLEAEVFPVSVVEVGEVPDQEPRWLEETGVAEQMAMDIHLPLRAGRVKNVEALLREEGAAVIENPSDSVEGPFEGLRNVYVVVDFGREVTGHPRVTLEGVAGAILDVGYSERLISGRLPPILQGVRYADRYVMRDGPQTWEVFEMKGLRYMQLVFRNLYGPVRVRSVSLNFSSYPVGGRGSFRCSDDLLNRIWEVSRYSLQLCMHDAYVDCPWREQQQWVGDARVQALVNYAAYGDTRLVAKLLRQVAQAQREDGMTTSTAASRGSTAGGFLADYCLAWVMMIGDYHLYTGDEGPVRELYPHVVRALAWFKGRLDGHGLLNEVPRFLIDWANLDRRGENTALNCLYLNALRAAADMARTVGEEDQAAEWEGLATRVGEGINRRLWSAERGVYVDCSVEGELSDRVSQHANALALLYDVAPPERHQGILSQVLDGGRGVVETEPFFTHYLLGALFRVGEDRRAVDLIRQKWGSMVARGATTTWEEWNYWGTKRSGRWIPRPRSLCHAWGASPAYQLSSEVLGVRPTRPGFREFSLKPKTVDLRWAKGVFPSPRGDIPVSWRRGEKSFTLEVRVPDGSTSDVAVPTLDIAEPEIWLDKERVWPSGEATKKPGRVKRMYEGEGYVHFVVEPGRHTFTVRRRKGASRKG